MTRRFSHLGLALALLLGSILVSSVLTSDQAYASARLDARTIAGFEGPKTGKEGAYLCTEAKCGGFSVVVFEDDRLSRLSRKEFERAQNYSKRLDRYFKAGFRFANFFSRTKINLSSTTVPMKIRGNPAIGQAITVSGKNESGLKHGYVVMVPSEKRQYTFAAIAASPAKAKNLALRFAKGLRF